MAELLTCLEIVGNCRPRNVHVTSTGSPLAPILANIFMRNFEEKAFNNFTGTHPKFYRRYVDDSFLLFQDKSEVQSVLLIYTF